MAHLSHCLRAGLVASGLAASGLAWTGSAMAAGIEMAEYAVPSDPGVQLYVREKHPAGAQQFGAERILLFVHGATYPAETSFDLPVGGASMILAGLLTLTVDDADDVQTATTGEPAENFGYGTPATRA